MKPKNGLFITFGDIEQVECHILAPPLSWSLLEAVALSWGSPLAMLKTFRRQSCEECMRMLLEHVLCKRCSWTHLGPEQPLQSPKAFVCVAGVLVGPSGPRVTPLPLFVCVFGLRNLAHYNLLLLLQLQAE